MGNGAAKVEFNFTDNTQFVSTPSTGLHFIQGVSEKGTPFKPDKIYNNWEAWVEDYGGLIEGNDTPTLVKILLEGGSTVRFSRVVGSTPSTDPTINDYIGDSATGTGLHAFDNYDDSMQLTTFGFYEDALNIAGATYAKQREDLQYYIWLGTGTKESLMEKRASVPTNPYVVFIAGKGTTIDPLTGAEADISVMADVLNNISASDAKYGPWYSFAGPNRGKITRFSKLTHNYGTKARIADLDQLADQQINVVISRNGRTMLWGNMTGQIESTQISQISVLRLVMYLKRVLVPLVEEYIDEPNINSTWQRIYYVAKPFLDGLIDKNALINYTWDGDQFITDPDKWKVNKPVEVQEGKYKIKLGITAISAIKTLVINLSLNDYSVEFSLDNN